MCDKESNCVASAFKAGVQCITYYGACDESNDGVNWGYQFYKPFKRERQYASLQNDHCNDYSTHKRWCSSGSSCGDNSQTENWPAASFEACQAKCDSEFRCVAVAFKSGGQCITYYGGCAASNDGVSWGYQFYKARTPMPVRSYANMGNDHCNDYADYKRFCQPGKDCGAKSARETWPSASQEACQAKCDEDFRCAAIAFSLEEHCIVYYGNCSESNDGTNWGLQYQRAASPSQTYVTMGTDHCNNYAAHKRWCSSGSNCGSNSQADSWPSASPTACQAKCDEDSRCVAIAFKANYQCITYYGTCTPSNDGINWGYQFYKPQAYRSLGSDHCNDYAGYKRWCYSGSNCGGNSQTENWPSKSVDACQRKCFEEAECVAIAFKAHGQCITYDDFCQPSSDGVNWGYQFYKTDQRSKEVSSLLHLVLGHVPAFGKQPYPQVVDGSCIHDSQCAVGLVCDDGECKLPPPSFSELEAKTVSWSGDIAAVRAYLDEMKAYSAELRNRELDTLSQYQQVSKWRSRKRQLMLTCAQTLMQAKQSKAKQDLAILENDAGAASRHMRDYDRLSTDAREKVNRLEKLTNDIALATDLLTNKARVQHAKHNAIRKKMYDMGSSDPSTWTQSHAADDLDALARDDIKKKVDMGVGGKITLYSAEASADFFDLKSDDGSTLFRAGAEASFEAGLCGEAGTSIGVCAEAGASVTVELHQTLFQNKHHRIGVAFAGKAYATAEAELKFGFDGVTVNVGAQVGVAVSAEVVYSANLGNGFALQSSTKAEAGAMAAAGVEATCNTKEKCAAEVELFAGTYVEVSQKVGFGNDNFGGDIEGSLRFGVAAGGGAEASMNFDGGDVTLEAEICGQFIVGACVSPTIRVDVSPVVDVVEDVADDLSHAGDQILDDPGKALKDGVDDVGDAAESAANDIADVAEDVWEDIEGWR
eukprot:TRINITY_DN7224_c0_g1_i1.p1 TRINITY_DN7224_c0_g1~~TRINITY_DN7224_c0_g1_i1.p1  ORF type:complete len:1052 (+),score=149.18 TRINITY_DN7224_c0_g1_i1:366-3158(+)